MILIRSTILLPGTQAICVFGLCFIRKGWHAGLLGDFILTFEKEERV